MAALQRTDDQRNMCSGEMEPRPERFFSVHDVAAALEQAAAHRGACSADEVLRTLSELFPASAGDDVLLADVQLALEEGVVMGIVSRVDDKYLPSGYPGPGRASMTTREFDKQKEQQNNNSGQSQSQ